MKNESYLKVDTTAATLEWIEKIDKGMELIKSMINILIEIEKDEIKENTYKIFKWTFDLSDTRELRWTRATYDDHLLHLLRLKKFFEYDGDVYLSMSDAALINSFFLKATTPLNVLEEELRNESRR